MKPRWIAKQKTSGGTWTYEQYSAWLSDAGLSDIGLHALGGRHLLTARK
ncbi:MAG: hypothetical protein PHS52_03415 [Desulfotomaculaceae bacterium]|nr:hypothetical protein [Desulfotomaculaceae bacterium]